VPLHSETRAFEPLALGKVLDPLDDPVMYRRILDALGTMVGEDDNQDLVLLGPVKCRQYVVPLQKSNSLLNIGISPNALMYVPT